MRILYFIILLNVTSSFIYADDSIRIVSFPKHIQFYTKLGPSYSEVEIVNPDVEDDLVFKPNPQSLWGFGFTYSWLSLGFSFALPYTDDSYRKYGKTEKFDFEAHYTMRRFFLDFTLKSYKGFYFSNPETYIPNWDENDPFPRAPSLQTASIAASFAYIFKPDKFSSNAAYTFTKAMRKRGGSWVLGGFISLNAVASDTSIVPAAIKQYVDPKLDLNGIVFANIGVSGGYSYLFTIKKKYFISLSLLPGLALQGVTQYSSIDGSESNYSALSVRTISRFSIGMNGDRYYWGISSYVESSIVKNNESQLSLNSGYTNFFFGYRLDTSNWRFMKKVDRVLHPRFLRFITGDPPIRD